MLKESLIDVFEKARGNEGEGIGSAENKEIVNAANDALSYLTERFGKEFYVKFNEGQGRITGNHYFSMIPLVLTEKSGTKAKVYFTLTCEESGKTPIHHSVRISLTQGSSCDGHDHVRKYIQGRLNGNVTIV